MPNRTDEEHAPMRTLPVALDVDAARVLADDLIRALAEHIDDPEAVDAVLTRWLDVLGATSLARVALATVQRTFSDCLSHVDAVPPGAVTFTRKEHHS